MYISPVQPSEIKPVTHPNRATPALRLVLWVLLGAAAALLAGALGPGRSPAPCGDDPAAVCAGP